MPDIYVSAARWRPGSHLHEIPLAHTRRGPGAKSGGCGGYSKPDDRPGWAGSTSAETVVETVLTRRRHVMRHS